MPSYDIFSKRQKKLRGKLPDVYIYDEIPQPLRVQIVHIKNVLIPHFLESHFTALRSSLESGVPTVRNKMSGHGQGVQPNAVPAHMAGYLLHLTATSILLMVEAEKQLP
jgi:hypothetical protein